MKRFRWFTLGFTAGVSGVAYAFVRLRKLREALTPRRVANSAAHRVADALDTRGRRLTGGSDTT